MFVKPITYNEKVLLLCLHQGTSAQQQIILKMNNDLQPIAERQAGIEAIPMLPAVLSTGEIQRLICQSETLKFNLPCENVKYLFSDWEIDVLSLNKSDYLTEFEVKVSRSDFKADSKKRKWQFYERKVETMISNYFYYACTNGLISVNEIPVFAGLLYVTNDGIETIKKAPLLHKAKHDRNKVLTKFCRIMSERSYLGCCRLTFENSKRRGS